MDRSGEHRRRKPHPAFRLGEFEIHPDLNRIHHGDRLHQIEPRLMHVLVCLACQPGVVVSREALLEEVWQGVIVSEEALTVAVSELRRVFGDSPRRPRVIETIRKGGYRLITPVEPLPAAATGAAAGAAPTAGAAPPGAPDATAPSASRPPSPRRPRRTRYAYVAAAILLFLLAIPLAGRFTRTGTPAPAVAPVLTPVPFTAYAGPEVHAAISRDGTRVAFAWTGSTADNLDIYVRQRTGEALLRITDDEAPEDYPTWSPDGSTVAFIRGSGPQSLCTVPALGGPVRTLLDSVGALYGLSWSPDGREIAYAHADTVGGLAGIFLLDLETLASRMITDPAAEYSCDFDPRFSPDGEWIAFTRSAGPAYAQDLYIVSPSARSIRRLTQCQRLVHGCAWEPDGRHLIFAARPATDLSLWRVSLDGRPPVWVPTLGGNASNPEISPAGDWMLYEETALNYDIWSVDLAGSTGEETREAVLIGSTRQDYAPRFSPDGSRVAFLSNRSGHREIWVARSDGTSAHPVTDFGGAQVLRPCWSPDGKTLACSVFLGSFAVLHCVDTASGTVRAIAPAEHHQLAAGWTSDGASILYNANPEGAWEVWRMDVAAGRAETATRCRRLMPGGRLIETVLPPRDQLLYRRTDRPGRWLCNLDGSEDRRIITGDAIARWQSAEFLRDGAYFVVLRRDRPILAWHDYASGEQRAIAELSGHGASYLCASPDRARILYCRTDQLECDLMAIQEPLAAFLKPH